MEEPQKQFNKENSKRKLNLQINPPKCGILSINKKPFQGNFTARKVFNNSKDNTKGISLAEKADKRKILYIK